MTAPLTPEQRAELRLVAEDWVKSGHPEWNSPDEDLHFHQTVALAQGFLDMADERDRLAAEAHGRRLLPGRG